MKYRLETSSRAQRQLDDFVDWWAAHHSPEQAERWYLAASRAIESLREIADRCPPAPEDVSIAISLRQLAFGSGRRRTHRVIFTLKPNQLVYILAVRHLAQDVLSADDLEIE